MPPKHKHQQEHTVFDVFTPTSQARLNFVDRDSINDQLVDALRTPGKQIVIYGESGSGKSTILQRKLEQLYPDHVTTRCNSATTFDNLLLDAFDQLDRYYIAVTTREDSKSVKAQTGLDFARFRASIEGQLARAAGATKERILPPQLTAQRLGEFMGSVGLCWVIEDFHKVLPEQKRPLAQTLKVFSDLSVTYRALRIVTIGATETAREVVEYDREMANRIAEIQVPMMTDSELREIVMNGQHMMNIEMQPIVGDIIGLSAGLAAVCHHLALNACLTRGIEVTSPGVVTLDEEDLAAAMRRYVEESSDTLKATFDRALARYRVKKFDNCRLILVAIANGPITGMLHAEVLAAIRVQYRSYPAGNLALYTRQLMSPERGSVLRRGIDGRYRFSEPLYHTYAQLSLGITSRPAQQRVLAILKQIIQETLNERNAIFLGSYGSDPTRESAAPHLSEDGR